MYDYQKEVKDGVVNWIEENGISDYGDGSREDIEEHLKDTLWAENTVTGNGEGSYTNSRQEAQENISENLHLVGEAYEAFGSPPDYSNPEAIDSTIRCYLLPQAITQALDELKISEVVSLEDFDILTFDDDTGTIIKYNGDKESLVIPSELDGIKINKIAYCSFDDCENLESVTIPDSIEKIEYYAFHNCKNLTITAPRGSYAERYCKESNVPFIAQEQSKNKAHDPIFKDKISLLRRQQRER